MASMKSRVSSSVERGCRRWIRVVGGVRASDNESGKERARGE